jgi:enoyl-CoA hydratase/carnithine racemase
MIDLERDGAVFVLRMRSGENRFNRPFLEAFHRALDEVEKSSGAAALVTAGEAKFYSNGLDLTWLSGDGAGEAAAFVGDFLRFFGRLMAFPMATVAAINGHAFAGGGMLALAHDFRIMRADRGFFCLPEIDLRLPLAAGMTALIESRLAPSTLRDAVLTGMRFGGADAAARGIVDEAVAAAEVLPRASARAAALADKDRATYAALKRGLYARTLAALERGE